MKNLRRLSIAVAFTLALAIPAFADGEISTTVAPPPPPSSQAQASTTDGEISTSITGQAETGSSETAVTESTTDAALTLLQSVLSLF